MKKKVQPPPISLSLRPIASSGNQAASAVPRTTSPLTIRDPPPESRHRALPFIATGLVGLTQRVTHTRMSCLATPAVQGGGRCQNRVASVELSGLVNTPQYPVELPTRRGGDSSWKNTYNATLAPGH